MGHSIHKHMKSFQSRELTDMPIMHDEKGEGRGGHEGALPNLGSPAKQYSEGYHQGKGWKHKVYGAKED